MTDHNNNRITQTFNQLAKGNQNAIIPFITTGDPDTNTTDVMHALVKGGATLIELGIPFSDPVADGPVIQKASERAIAKGVSCKDSLNAIAVFRETNQNTPVVLMGYLNTCEIYEGGFKGFAEDAANAGVDGVILVDLSYESGKPYRETLNHNGIIPIQLISPTTSMQRIKQLVSDAKGFVYYVSMRGTTGSNNTLNTQEISSVIRHIKAVKQIPVCVGFGIKNGETAKQMADFSDGIVVGSALVKNMYNTAQQNGDISSTATNFIAEINHSINP